MTILKYKVDEAEYDYDYIYILFHTMMIVHEREDIDNVLIVTMA